MAFDYRPRITNDMMQGYFSKPVILLGRVASIEPSGKKVCVKDCSGQNVMVYLAKPIDGVLELDSWVEAEGKVKGKGHMDGEILKLPSSLFDNFDQELYVSTIKMLVNPGTANNYIVEDKGEHHGEGNDIELISNPGDSGKSDLDGMAEESFLNL
ncbi:replication protein A 14 kDa subunit-like [Panonychus citri]|uniref:replication protein A 14 kDa subunit-like n=1 Tax=Panonychus citri TaxID=50023 RepID=UPI0023083445|nr:replication protein A 14 kDa subunit-like [Panonychus citri]